MTLSLPVGQARKKSTTSVIFLLRPAYIKTAVPELVHTDVLIKKIDFTNTFW